MTNFEKGYHYIQKPTTLIMASYLSQFLHLLSSAACKNNSDIELPTPQLINRKRNLSEVLEEDPEMPPLKKQKVQACETNPFAQFAPEETSIISFETEAEYNARMKDEEIAALKLKNKKLKSQLSDKDEIIKILTKQLAAKKSDARYNVEFPVNFGVFNCS